MANSRVGSRSGKYGSRGTENAPDSFLTMLYNGVCKFTVHSKPGRVNEPGPDIILSIAQMGRVGRVELNLSDMTELELEAMRDLINEALEWSMPVARRRDSEALDEFNKGNDSFERVYRQTPAVVYRKRPQREYSEGIFDGPEDVPTVQRSDESADHRVGGTGSDVVEPDTQD